MKLNLGAGVKEIPGYDNLDGATGDVIYPLNHTSLDAIRASHVLEHFGINESQLVVKDWVSCLKVGGTLLIAVPDFNVLLSLLETNPTLPFESIVMGGQQDELDYHKSLWTEDKLRSIMQSAGLSQIERWESEIVDCASYPFSANLRGVK